MGSEEKMQDRSRPFTALLHSSFQPTPLLTRSLGSDRFPQQSLCRFVGPRRTWHFPPSVSILPLDCMIAKMSVKDNERAIIEAVSLFASWVPGKNGELCERQLVGSTFGCYPLELPKRQVGKDGTRENWRNGLPYPAFTYLFFFLLWPRACLLITVQNITMSKALTCFNPHKISCDAHLPHQNFVGSCQDTGCLIGKGWKCTPECPQPRGIHPLHWPYFR